MGDTPAAAGKAQRAAAQLAQTSLIVQHPAQPGSLESSDDMANFRQQCMLSRRICEAIYNKARQQLTLMLRWWGGMGLLSLLRARRPTTKESSALAGRARR